MVLLPPFSPPFCEMNIPFYRSLSYLGFAVVHVRAKILRRSIHTSSHPRACTIWMQRRARVAQRSCSIHSPDLASAILLDGDLPRKRFLAGWRMMTCFGTRSEYFSGYKRLGLSRENSFLFALIYPPRIPYPAHLKSSYPPKKFRVRLSTSFANLVISQHISVFTFGLNLKALNKKLVIRNSLVATKRKVIDANISPSPYILMSVLINAKDI